jgi:hypothetical protein
MKIGTSAACYAHDIKSSMKDLQTAAQHSVVDNINKALDPNVEYQSFEAGWDALVTW